MSKKVTMDDIAEKLGISKNTVSLALRGMPGISESTRKVIEQTAREMGYTYKVSARKNTMARNLCLIIAKSTRDSIGFFSYVQLGIEDEAKKNNLNTIIHYYDENVQGFETPNCVKDGMVSGIITLGRISRETINCIVGYNLPVVMVDNYFDNLSMDYILTDNHSGGYAATEYLIDCGHTKIGFLGDISASISFYDRYQGFLKALRDRGIEINEGYSITDKKLEELPQEDITGLVNEIRTKAGLPTAFFCCNDAEAIVIIKVLKNIGVLVPNKISIIGFDDIENAANVTPELTTMRVQKEIMGKGAVCKLMEKLEQEIKSSEKILLSACLIKRNSVNRSDMAFHGSC
ncbi:LacI family DNA-binding transcriptional regulator [Ruminiclostridium cellulolyticum]|uniref:Transcriptional regulator, LacI family n=1 Tax=Ruminiclostridium cellulolyticum (strain ATCC 35319 / DSM 5812 / JCM 6584 / H10) TaxID=394503 RepID=B8I8W2_RUMCH|nr:LacI family DNA-binding transcriptional regulator [Ruminiclostridium cellulolyticum]ACL77294.1 transcriptional regulator, LacI family [Ruminiclostridium cellulolyticum H10]